MPIEIDIAARLVPGRGNVSVVRFRGELDAASAEAAKRALEGLVTAPPGTVVLDFEGLRFLDSRGIGVLLWARQEVRKRGGTILVANIQPKIRKVFEILKALPAMRIFEDRAELDAYLRAEQEQAEEGAP